MKPSPYLICAIMLLLVSVPALASQQTFEFHRDARMQHRDGAPVRDAYGYVYVVTDKKGHGVIRVLFSNGTRLDNARFNAQVKFLGAGGELVRKESFSQRIAAAGSDGAAELSLSKLVALTEFASVQVEFFVSDVPSVYKPADRAGAAYLRTRYSGD